MKTSSAKGKGRDLQKHIAAVLRETFDLEEDDVVSRPMGSPGEDIMMSPMARKKIPLSIESKNTKSFPSLAGLDQSRANCRGHLPAVVWKPFGKNKNESIIYFNLNEFAKWLEGLSGNEEEDK